MQHLDEGTIHAWLDDALSAEEARQAEAHVGACESCAAAVAEARGLIAASSMILSKLDTFPASVEPRFDAGTAPVDELAAARAASAARQRPAERRWFGGAGVRAAAAVLVLAGGAALVQSVTGRDELARVVNDQALESKVSSAESVPAEPMVAQDATAASAEQAPAPPPPPVVTAAPVHPRPQTVRGGRVTASEAAPPLPVRIADGGAVGAAAAADASREATTATAAPAATGRVAGAASVEEGANRRLEERLRRVEQPRERDFSDSGKAAGALTPAPSANTATPLVETLRFADSTLAQQSARRATEQGPARQQLAPPAAAPSSRLARAEASAADMPAAVPAQRCYALTLGAWSSVNAPPPAAPPTRIVLSPDTGTVGPSKGQRLVRPMPGFFEGSYQGAWWTEVSPSTLVLTWATGPEGIVMRLVRSGDALAGTARTFGTAGGVEQSINVQGERLDCGDAR